MNVEQMMSASREAFCKFQPNMNILQICISWTSYNPGPQDQRCEACETGKKLGRELPLCGELKAWGRGHGRLNRAVLLDM